jgi:hypothetical protein
MLPLSQSRFGDLVILQQRHDGIKPWATPRCDLVFQPVPLAAGADCQAADGRVRDRKEFGRMYPSSRHFGAP